MLSDPQFWVAVAFVIFMIAIFKPVKKILTLSLDSKINEIKKNIEEAEKLKNETQFTLSDIKKRQNEVELEIKEIHSKTKERIKILESQSQMKLSELSDKKNIMAKTKIDQMARDIKIQIQLNISHTAIETVIKILEKKLDVQEKQNLIDQSIADLALILKN